MTCNRLELTKQWIGQLKAKAGIAYKHVIVDNGSTDGTADWLQEQGYTVLRNDQNLGIMGDWKQAYEFALDNGFTPDLIVKYDDDCEIKTPNILKKMAYFVKATHGEYIIAPKDDNIDPSYEPKNLEPETDQLVGFKVKITPSVGGMLMMCSREAFEKLLENGGVPRDCDRGTYWREHGYKMAYLKDLHVAHQGGNKSLPQESYKF